MRVQRWEAQDDLLRDGEAVVLIRGSVIRLAALGTAVYTLTEEPIEIDDLAVELEVRFGVPTDGSTLEKTKDAVADLVRYGILRRV